MRSSVLGMATMAVCLFGGTAVAGTFSFQGTFTADDQLQVFLFSAPSASVLLRTWSYAGGTNAASTPIHAGGFNPVLTLFDATGGLSGMSILITSNDDGAGVATDSSTGNAYDSLLSLTGLNAGHTYALILSENDNLAIGPAYGDGFSEAGNGNFTGSLNNCGGTDPFCENGLGINGPVYRNGNWAVDITGVRDATEQGAAVPEPASVGLLAAGAAILAALKRRRARA